MRIFASPVLLASHSLVFNQWVDTSILLFSAFVLPILWRIKFECLTCAKNIMVRNYRILEFVNTLIQVFTYCIPQPYRFLSPSVEVVDSYTCIFLISAIICIPIDVRRKRPVLLFIDTIFISDFRKIRVHACWSPCYCRCTLSICPSPVIQLSFNRHRCVFYGPVRCDGRQISHFDAISLGIPHPGEGFPKARVFVIDKMKVTAKFL